MAFENFRKAGQDGYRSITVWVRSVSPLKRGMTAAAFQSFGISDDTKERLNRPIIVVAIISLIDAGHDVV